eukprot:9718192-Prorocentrum_lima.AAC.1
MIWQSRLLPTMSIIFMPELLLWSTKSEGLFLAWDCRFTLVEVKLHYYLLPTVLVQKHSGKNYTHSLK